MYCAPCQSFTTTGNNKGWDHALGTVLANSIVCAAASNMTTLVLENSGQLIQNDKHFQFLKSILEFWGYFIVACDVVRMEQMHPATRNRSILIAVKQQFVDSNVRPQMVGIALFIPKSMGGVMRDRLGPLPSPLLQFLDLVGSGLQAFQ